MRLQKALIVFEDMKKYKVKADVVTFNGLISSCVDLRSAMDIMQQMEFCGFLPDRITFNTMISMTAKSTPVSH